MSVNDIVNKMPKRGFRHLVQCHCILPQYRGNENPIFHKFTVFSVIDENDNVESKFQQCPNCGVVHKIFDICKSEILIGSESGYSLTTIEDLKISIPEKISDILEKNKCDISVWENVDHILQNELWGQKVSLVRDRVNESVVTKFLRIDGESRLKIETQESSQTVGYPNE